MGHLEPALIMDDAGGGLGATALFHSVPPRQASVGINANGAASECLLYSTPSLTSGNVTIPRPDAVIVLGAFVGGVTRLASYDGR